MNSSRALLARRAGARILDSAILALLTSIVLGFFTKTRSNGSRVVDAPAAIVVLIIVGVFLYECLLLRATGATPGKIALRLRVETVDGAPLEWRHAVLRAAVPTVVIAVAVAIKSRGLMPYVVILLYATALGVPDRRGVVDRVAGTRVVRA